MRPTRKAPRGAVVLGICALALQLTIGATRPAPTAHAAALPPPPSPPLLALARTFDRLPAAHMLLVYLQAFDNQPGISIPYRELDYGRVIGWLAAALELPKSALEGLTVEIETEELKETFKQVRKGPPPPPVPKSASVDVDMD